MNDAAHRSDRPDRFFGVNLDGGDFQTDIFGGFSCLLGEFFDFVGDDRKTFASLSGASSFDGGVQGQQIRLLRDRSDDLDDFSDLQAGMTQLSDCGSGGLGRANRG